MSRREVVDNVVSDVQRSTTELRAICAELDHEVTPALDSYTPEVCRATAEFVRDMNVRIGDTLARIQQSCGMLKALAIMPESEAKP